MSDAIEQIKKNRLLLMAALNDELNNLESIKEEVHNNAYVRGKIQGLKDGIDALQHVLDI